MCVCSAGFQVPIQTLLSCVVSGPCLEGQDKVHHGCPVNDSLTWWDGEGKVRERESQNMQRKRVGKSDTAPTSHSVKGNVHCTKILFSSTCTHLRSL